MKKRYKRRKTSYLLIFVIVLLSISTGYAALNSTLIIMGTSAIQKNIWDVHFENLNIKEGSVTATTEPTITDSNRISDFTFVLDKRGDFYEFTVDVVNNGSLDAMVNNVEKTPTLTSEQEKYLTYKITYENGEEIKKNQLLKVNDFVRIKVRVEFKSNITASDLPQTQHVLNLGFVVNYIQAEDNGDFVDNNGKLVKVVSGSGTNTGDEVCFGKECFYVISSTNEKITMISKYNLYVGNETHTYCIPDSDDCTDTYYPYTDEATGIQDSSMLGWKSGMSISNGTWKFSDTNYWNGAVDSYPANVYNSSSSLYGYIENYKTYLKSNSLNVIDARLITKEDLESLGCVISKWSCTEAPSWVYNITYWSSIAYGENTVLTISDGGGIGANRYLIEGFAGVRPVIEIDRSTIPVESVIPIANASLDAIGTMVTIGSEQFYTIGTEGDNVKLLSMYNLYVGNIVDENWNITPLASPTGKQSELAIGYNWDSENSVEKLPFIGSTLFSYTKNTYAGSIVEGYVNNYKTILESDYGVDVVEARLITRDELISIGCYNPICEGAPNWVYATSYWSGEVRGDYLVEVVSSSRYFYPDEYSIKDYYGVRPVIVISKSLF